MNKLLLIALGFFALTGCSELEPFLPKVKFDTLSVRNISFQEANVDFVFSIENPNPVNVKLASFSYALGFEEIPLLSGEVPGYPYSRVRIFRRFFSDLKGVSCLHY